MNERDDDNDGTQFPVTTYLPMCIIPFFFFLNMLHRMETIRGVLRCMVGEKEAVNPPLVGYHD